MKAATIPAPPWDKDAMRAAIEGASSWDDACDRYNAASGEAKPRKLKTFKEAARRYGMPKAWARYRCAPPGDVALRAAIRVSVGWEQVAEAYNAATGEGRSVEAIKTRAYALGLKLANRKSPGPVAGYWSENPHPQRRDNSAAGRSGPDDPREIALRVQRWRLYKECHGIAANHARDVTDKQFEEAMTGDPTDWPDPPVGGDCEGSGFRRPKVYRMRLPRGVAG